jgi:hypothetical protein
MRQPIRQFYGGFRMRFNWQSGSLRLLIGVLASGMVYADGMISSKQVDQGNYLVDGSSFIYRKCDYFKYYDNGEYFKYYDNGQYYNYNVNGTFYKYFVNGDYYNYLVDGQYFKYQNNGMYYNYQNNGIYYKYFIDGNYFNSCQVVPARWVRGVWELEQLVCK